ncbi:hypothetical protein Sjap_021068 [Stephania japonica]|uniref:Uncharacterized protein n=1 Tax=Stephania japonica TaxID=461633 RepID=A0AAP0I164_9MAGN
MRVMRVMRVVFFGGGIVARELLEIDFFRFREVGQSVWSSELDRRLVVDLRGLLRRVVGSEPEPHSPRGVSDLRRPLPPRSLPHTAELLPGRGRGRGSCGG